MTIVQRVEAMTVIVLALAGLLAGAAAAAGVIPVAPPQAVALLLSAVAAVKLVSVAGAVAAYAVQPLSRRGL